MMNLAAENADAMEDDPTLVERCLRDDRTAWVQLVRRYQRLVFAIASRMGLPQQTAEDVFQTVFIRLYENLPDIQDPGRLRAWITTTAKRESLLQVKRARREPTLSSQNADGYSGEFDVVDPTPDANEELIIVQELDRMRAAIDTLDPRCQQLLQLVYSDDDVSYEQIAELLGMAVGSIGPTRARCLDKLRAALATG